MVARLRPPNIFFILSGLRQKLTLLVPSLAVPCGGCTISWYSGQSWDWRRQCTIWLSAYHLIHIVTPTHGDNGQQYKIAPPLLAFPQQSALSSPASHTRSVIWPESSDHDATDTVLQLNRTHRYHHDQQQHRAMQLHLHVSFALRYVDESLVPDCLSTAAAARLAAATARSKYHAQLHLLCRVYKPFDVTCTIVLKCQSCSSSCKATSLDMTVKTAISSDIPNDPWTFELATSSNIYCICRLTWIPPGLNPMTLLASTFKIWHPALQCYISIHRASIPRYWQM
jgi:hypothetical protein